jgi:hypothetical protein
MQMTVYNFQKFNQQLKNNKLQLQTRLLHTRHLGLLVEYCQQADQIGRIFAHWAFVYFGKFILITELAKIFGLFFPTV